MTFSLCLNNFVAYFFGRRELQNKDILKTNKVFIIFSIVKATSLQFENPIFFLLFFYSLEL